MAGGDWTDERMEVVYGEARAVLDAQNDTMGDIDTKAMRTVRFTVLLIGVLLTATRYGGLGLFDTGVLYLSIGSLTTSAVLGVVTYNESDLFVGPSGTYIESLAHGVPTDERWDRHLLETFGGMISENKDDIRWNSGLLTLSQASLVFGIVSGILATAI